MEPRSRNGRMNLLDESLLGQRFNRLTLLGFAGKDKRYNTLWEMQCECSNVKTIRADFVIGGKTRSCGCLQREAAQRVGKLRRGNPSHNRRDPYGRSFRAAARNAKIRNLEFAIDLQWYRAFVEANSACHYCHRQLSWVEHPNTNNTDGKRDSVASNMDRMNNSIGYVPTNIAACCAKCNWSKGAAYSYAEWWEMTRCFRETKTEHGQEGKSDVIDIHTDTDITTTRPPCYNPGGGLIANSYAQLKSLCAGA